MIIRLKASKINSYWWNLWEGFKKFFPNKLSLLFFNQLLGFFLSFFHFPTLIKNPLFLTIFFLISSTYFKSLFPINVPFAMANGRHSVWGQDIHFNFEAVLLCSVTICVTSIKTNKQTIKIVYYSIRQITGNIKYILTLILKH